MFTYEAASPLVTAKAMTSISDNEWILLSLRSPARRKHCIALRLSPAPRASGSVQRGHRASALPRGPPTAPAILRTFSLSLLKASGYLRLAFWLFPAVRRERRFFHAFEPSSDAVNPDAALVINHEFASS